MSRSYTDAVECHFRASVLDALPPQYDSLLQQIEDEDAGSSYDMSAQRSAARARLMAAAHSRHPRRAVPEPNLDGHVFCRVKEDKGHIEIDECAP
jgi:GINS complex subunit 4